MISVTHDQVEAMTMADKIAVLRAGKVDQFGTPLDLFNAPKNRFVAGFIGSPAMNFVEGVIGDNGVRLNGETLIALDKPRAGLAAGDAVELGVRPRDLVIDPDGSLSMTVSKVEQTDTRIGERIRLSVAPSAAYLFRKDNGLACY